MTSTVDFIGSAFELDTGSGFQPIGYGVLTADSGILRGTLASGDLFEIAYDHNAAASTISLSAVVPLPTAMLMLCSGLLGLGSFAVGDKWRKLRPE